MSKTAIQDKPVTQEKHTAKFLGKTITLDHDPAEEQKTIRTVIPFVAKSINDEDRTIEFIGSTATIDRYGDSIVQAGWEIGNFVKNPVIPWSHNYDEPPVAQGIEVGLKEGNLAFTAKFPTIAELSSDPDHPSEWALFCDAIYNGYKGGYLRAFSVGFIPLEMDGNWADGYTFHKCELLEVSCVTVPANPEALVLAFKEGALDERHKRAMVSQAEKLIKSLTDEPESVINESMNDETKAYIDEQFSKVFEAIAQLKDAPSDGGTAPEPSEEPDGGSGEDEQVDEKAVRDEVRRGLTKALGIIE